MEVQILSKEEIRANAIAQLQKRKKIADVVITSSTAGVIIGSGILSYQIAKGSVVLKTTASGAVTAASAPFWIKAIVFTLWFLFFTWLGYEIIKFGAELFSVKQLNDLQKIEE